MRCQFLLARHTSDDELRVYSLPTVIDAWSDPSLNSRIVLDR